MMRDNRDSNIELFRIVLMLLIITHHYVVNSGIVFFNDIESVDTISSRFLVNTVIAQCIGWGGKVGINGFILITGYFMCESRTNIRKWTSLLTEVLFYNALINALFLAFHYMPYGKGELWKGFFSLGIIKGLEPGPGNDSFITYYLLLYLLIPYINRMISGMDKRMYQKLICLLLVIYTCITTFSLGRVISFSALGCYIMIYLIGGYIRRYELIYDSVKCGLIGLLASVILMFGYIFASDIAKIKFGLDTGGGYYPVDGINKLLAISIAVSAFIVFKNIDIANCSLINTIASTTLGVLCIHTNSGTMRDFLWKDLLGVPASQDYATALFVVRSILIPVAVFAVCACIDLVRQKLFSAIDRFVFRHLKHYMVKW